MLFNKYVICRGIWLDAIHLILSRHCWSDPLSQNGIGNLVLIKIIEESSSRFSSLWGRSNKQNSFYVELIYWCYNLPRAICYNLTQINVKKLHILNNSRLRIFVKFNETSYVFEWLF